MTGMRLSSPQRRPPLTGFGLDFPNGINPENVLRAEQCAQSRKLEDPSCKALADKAASEGTDSLGLGQELGPVAVLCAQSQDPTVCARALMDAHVLAADTGIYTPQNLQNVASCVNSLDVTSSECQDVAALAATYGLEAIVGTGPWGAAIACARNPSVENCAEAGLKAGLAAGCAALSLGVAAPLCGPLSGVIGSLVWPVVDTIFVKGPVALVGSVTDYFAPNYSCGNKDNLLAATNQASRDKYWEMVDTLEGHWRDFLARHGLKYEPYPYISSRQADQRAPWELDDGMWNGTLGLFLDNCFAAGAGNDIVRESGGEHPGQVWLRSGGMGQPTTQARGPFDIVASGWGSSNPAECFDSFQVVLGWVVKGQWDRIQKGYTDTLLALSAKASEMAHAALSAKMKLVLARTNAGIGARGNVVSTIQANQAALKSKIASMRGIKVPSAVTTAQAQASASLQQKLGLAVSTVNKSAAARQTAVAVAASGKSTGFTTKQLAMGAGAIGLLAVAALVLSGGKG